VPAAAGGTVTRDDEVLGYAKSRFKSPRFIAKGRI